MGFAPVFAKKRNQYNSSREAPDMGSVGNASGARIHGARGLVEKLEADPKDQQEPSGQVDDAEEWSEQEDQRFDAGMRKENEVSAQHPRNCTRSADRRDGRGGIKVDVRCRGRETREQIEKNEAQVSHAVFDVITEDPEIEHVAYDMHPSPVQKHGGPYREVAARPRNMGPRQRSGDYAHLIDESVEVSRFEGKLVEKNRCIRNG